MGRAHILVVPYPAQGHMNPMLQFSKRLVSKGVKVTLAQTVSHSSSMQVNTGTITIDTFSDGYDDIAKTKGTPQGPTVEDYQNSIRTVGSRTLTDLIKKLKSNGNGICCVVYDAFLPWVLDVAKGFGVIGAVFFTQSCAVNSIYYHVQSGALTISKEVGSVASVTGLPKLKISDLPSFISGGGSYPPLLTMMMNQFRNIHQADWIFLNTFYELEPEVVKCMLKMWPIKTIGPTLPSMYLDGRVEGDRDYGLEIFETSKDKCMNWLNTKGTQSVVYVSFGSNAMLSVEQMEELAWALKESNNYFMWVVRAAEKEKLPDRFVEETSEKGLVVNWCPQLEVLSHQALGCFITHCGWNSTLEAVSLGIPMVAMPQWTDQPTNAKFVEDEWRMGLRVGTDENGVSRRGVIAACIREIMEGTKGKEIRRNATKWKQIAKQAVDEGGSSDKNIDEFVAALVKHV